MYKSLLILFTFIQLITYGQNAEFNLVNRYKIGGNQMDLLFDYKVLNNGTQYVTGEAWDNSWDIQPGAGTYNLTSTGVDDVHFFAKYDNNFNVIWGFMLGDAGAGGGNQDEQKAFDVHEGTENMVIAGVFKETMDFDPGAGTSNLTSTVTTVHDSYVAMYDQNGNYQWSFKLGHDILGGRMAITSMKFDAAGYIYIIGNYRDSIDFDPGPGLSIQTVDEANWNKNGFIAKYDVNGNFIWVKTMPGVNFGGGVYPDNLIFNSNNELCIGGTVSRGGDIDPSAATNIITPLSTRPDFFISKYDINGNIIWGKHAAGGLGNKRSMKLNIDNSNNFVFTAKFKEDIIVDPSFASNTVTNIAPANVEDVLVAKFDDNGNFIWSFNYADGTVYIGSAYPEFDSDDNVYVGGHIGATTDFDPSANTANVSIGGGLYNGTLAKYDSDGNYICAFSIPSAFTSSLWKLQQYNNNIYAAGGLTGTADYDPSSTTNNMTTTGNWDIGIAIYSPCPTIDTTITLTLCFGDSVLTGNSYKFLTGVYYDTLQSSGFCSCDSIVITDLTILPENLFSQSPNICFGASFTVGTSTYNVTGIYTDILVDINGCDSTVTTNLTVLPENTFTQSPSICFGTNFTVGTSTYNSTGTYTDILTDINGCDSTVTTNLTVLPANTFTQSPTICDGTSFIVGSSTYSTSGTFVDVLTDVNGCDSTVTTNLTVLPANTFSQSPTVCFGVSFTVGTSTYTTSGTFTDILTDINGCDSTVTTNLTVLPSNTLIQSPTICFGASFTVGSSTYSTSGTFTDILIDVNGCDSTVTTNLTVLLDNTFSQSLSICFGASFTIGSSTYNTTGNYTDVLTDINGCDSTVTTNLTVLPANTFSQSPTICAGQSFTVGASTYNSTGNYTDILTDLNGCDSTVTTNLTVLPQNTFSQSPTICDGASFTVGTSTYITSGTFVDVLVDINGCDSTVTTNLTVLPANTFTQSPTICFGSSYTVGTSVYSTSGVYTDVFVSGNGCDSTVTTNLTVLPANEFSQSPSICAGQSFTVGSSVYTTTGTFVDVLVDVNGCDSTITTNLTVNPIDDANFNYTSSNFCLSGNNPSATISGSLGGIFSIDNAGVINPTTGEIDLLGSGTGTFTVTYSTNGACPSSSNASITIDPLDDASFTYPSATYCNNDPSPSPTISGVLGGTFTIDNGGVIDANTGVVSLGGAGLGSFTITYTTSGLCAETETFTLTISNCSPPFANFSVNDTLLCEGQCIEITNLSVDATSVLWTMVGGTPSTSTDLNPTVCYLSAGTYIIEMIVTNGNGSDTITKTINVNTSPTIDAGSDVTIPLGATTPLFVTGATSYIWSPSQYLDCSICEDPTAAPSATTSFVVIGTDDNGCTATDTVIVIIEGEISIFIPNVFSPNGDGENDLFKVLGSSFPERYSMQIYNRWGALVFESEDQNTNWAGLDKKDEIMPQAVFVYRFIGTTVSGQIVEKAGNVMLTR